MAKPEKKAMLPRLDLFREKNLGRRRGGRVEGGEVVSVERWAGTSPEPSGLWLASETYLTVDRGPMIIVTPLRKRRLPMARKPLSKKNKHPRNMKNTPNPVSPRPIFRRSSSNILPVV